jgi:hypothetical protein
VNNGKGTTDALLVVDAMDLLHAARLPAVVAIASSDADFAPLALRLREAGIRVICFAQSGKSADGELARCYDQLISVEGVAIAPVAPQAPEPAPRASRKAPARKRAAAAEEPQALGSRLRGNDEGVSSPRRRGSRAADASAASEDPVRAVLASVEGFLLGRSVELNEVVKRLRAGKLLGKNASGAAFLKKNAPYVELTPAQQPNRLHLKEGAG